MPGKVLLDTNIVIALFSGEKAISEHLAGAEVVVPSIVLGELYYGARKSGRTAQNLTRIDHFATSVSVVGCDAVAAQYYGRIKDRLRSKGSPIPENDIWIAHPGSPPKSRKVGGDLRSGVWHGQETVP